MYDIQVILGCKLFKIKFMTVGEPDKHFIFKKIKKVYRENREGQLNILFIYKCVERKFLNCNAVNLF
jgi:hypothetical protein